MLLDAPPRSRNDTVQTPHCVVYRPQDILWETFPFPFSREQSDIWHSWTSVPFSLFSASDLYLKMNGLAVCGVNGGFFCRAEAQWRTSSVATTAPLPLRHTHFITEGGRSMSRDWSQGTSVDTAYKKYTSHKGGVMCVHVCICIKRLGELCECVWEQAWRGQNNQPVSALYGGEYYITVTTKAVKCCMLL